jgi:hypothetical protein
MDDNTNQIKSNSNVILDKPLNHDEHIEDDTDEETHEPLESLKKIKEYKLDKSNKRGRKSKVPFDPRQYDNEYITLWEDIVEGEKVLVDNNNNVYTFDIQTPVYIGKKDVNIKLDVRKFMDKLALSKASTPIPENKKI